MGGISVLLLLGILSTIFWFFVAIFFIIAIYLLITYIFESVAISRINKNQKCNTTFTAWIPFYNKYLLGKIANLKNQGIVLGIINIIIVIMFIYFYYTVEFNLWLLLIFFILVITSFILNIVISHKIFTQAIGKYGDIFTVFSVLSLGILRPIFLFIIRNNNNIRIKTK